MLATVRQFFRNHGPWGSFPKIKHAPVWGADYQTPPELVAEQEARRRGRRIIDVGNAPGGGAVFVYEGDPPPPGTTLHPTPSKAAAV
jgi:hypothetical protein